jgi:Na+-transporting NADH:ubiquinone oxidoreductase subunit NqrB
MNAVAELPPTRTSMFPRDPRYYQIVSLSLLLIYGTARLNFDVSAGRVVTILATVLSVQFLAIRLCDLPVFDPKSALISGLSLCLLLRTNFPALAIAGAVAAVGGKFLLRVRGKHLFNPTNFALVLLLICAPDHAWVSPAQWGSVAFFGFLMLCVGGMVVHRAARGDVVLAFLGCYLGLVFGRSLWLGEPMAIPLHRLQSGSLLLFAFFMISDPKTTPDSRMGRVFFGVLVAFGAAWIQFRLFRTNGLLWSLGACSLLVPVLDLLLPGKRYRWQDRLLSTDVSPDLSSPNILIPNLPTYAAIHR